MIDTKVSIFLKKQGIHLQGKSVAVGVSGGPDSLALLHYLWRMKEKFDLNLLALHVDHMFRGAESYQDALFVRDFCEERKIPFEMIQVNVPEYMKSSGKSSQTAAREQRYQFFEKAMKKHRMELLALAHHGDDQIETILMRLTRGSSGKARAGMPFSRPIADGQIIRPFLCLTKAELESYCEDHQLKPRLDPSNEKDFYIRNRFRRHVLPFLKKENPHVHVHFQRFSEELEKDDEYLIELTNTEMNKVMRKTEGAVTLRIDDFLAMPIPLQRRGIKLILDYLYKELPTSLSAIHIDSIYSMIQNPHPSGSLDFPNGLKITRSYGDLYFEANPVDYEPFSIEINGPGLVKLPDGGMLEAKYWTNQLGEMQKDWSFYVNMSDTNFPLIIRTRRTGDRMSVKGMTGTKKLKDIFIEKKIPLFARDQWPVITDSNDKILWVPGLKKSSDTVEDETMHDAVLILIYKHDLFQGAQGQ
ncbi:tRNA lysidine(34) synthetase TilS [Bacillus sp. B15-48]|uniref:tRNA lysidine(34) synthetase TilS n=1 Tax=Bacillus sp. B15-48 TaxID=1548601 RepID=UPI00193F496A|nr:tRNA lysidine(34) synthetase TilS [Bacillus sp. B15-48]MBM4765297.1 tRNA lysidine(34) synthetase TilS [Bacillus sp. B15-48]